MDPMEVDCMGPGECCALIIFTVNKLCKHADRLGKGQSLLAPLSKTDVSVKLADSMAESHVSRTWCDMHGRDDYVFNEAFLFVATSIDGREMPWNRQTLEAPWFSTMMGSPSPAGH
jgi:hypothetical protein